MDAVFEDVELPVEKAGRGGIWRKLWYSDSNDSRAVGVGEWVVEPDTGKMALGMVLPMGAGEVRVFGSVTALERVGHCHSLCKIGAGDPEEGTTVKEGADAGGRAGMAVFPTRCTEVLLVAGVVVWLGPHASTEVGTIGE